MKNTDRINDWNRAWMYEWLLEYRVGPRRKKDAAFAERWSRTKEQLRAS